MATAQLTPVGVGIRNVLIATDCSEFSNTALAFGLQLATGVQAKAYVISVLPCDTFLLSGPEAYVGVRDATERDLAGLKTALLRDGYREGEDYQLSLLEGDVIQSILDFAYQRQIDLIVVGTHGRGGLGKMIMGSVAERVFRQSPVPVLTVGPHLPRAARGTVPRNLLLPVDFTPASELAAHYAVRMALQNDAKLTLLHVIESWSPEAQAHRERVLQILKDKIASLLGEEARGLHCCSRVEQGHVVPAILQLAAQIEADLLVMGVPPSKGVFDRLIWPHAYEVVREARCPVLTVRADAAEGSL